MEHPKSFKLLTISAEKLPASMARQAETDQYAADRARLLFGCYRTGDANDAETYVAAISAVLARYPQEVITAVTHPVMGLPSDVKWLPSVMEVREACDRVLLPIRSQQEREKRIAEQMEARKLDDELKGSKPTYEQMKAKYGENWGLSNPDRAKHTPVPAPTIEQLRHHYQHYGLEFKPKVNAT